MEKASSVTASAVNHTVTVAATTIYQTLIHTASGRTKTTTMIPASTSLSTPTSVPAQLDPSVQIAELLSTWPQCIQPVASAGTASSGCGPDAQCICADKTFPLMILGGMTQNCTPPDIQLTQSSITKLCPHLGESRTSEVVIIMLFITILALISVALRIVSRKMGRVKFGWDDWLIFFAMVAALGESIAMLKGASVGLGKHLITLSGPQITAYLKTFWAIQFFFSFSVTAIKLSILFFYRRIFPSQGTYIALIATGCFQIAWFLAQFISVMLSCRPIAYFWDKTIPNGQCINENTISYVITAASLLADLIIFAIPIPSLWGLKRSLSQRVGLIALFATGALVCVAGIVRIPFLIQMDVNDLTWSIVPAAIWIMVETKIGIVCACLPTLLPLFRKAGQTLRSQLSSFSSSSGSPSHQHGEPIVLHASKSSGGGCLNCNCSQCSGSRAMSNAEIEKPVKKQRGWYSAALSNVSRPETGMRSESVEEIVVKPKKGGDHIV